MSLKYKVFLHFIIITFIYCQDNNGYWFNYFNDHSKIPALRDGIGIVLPERFNWFSYIERSDGALMIINSNWTTSFSYDGGKNWSEPTGMDAPGREGYSISSVIRLNDGSLGMFAVSENNEDTSKDNNFIINRLKWYISYNEGKTWESPVTINPTGELGLPYYDTVIQTRDGTIIIPVRRFNQGHSGLSKNSGAYGTIDGKRKKIEGHAHWPELDVSFVYLSENLGKTWKRSEGEIYIWKDDGYGGAWPMDEPNVVELKNGNLLMFGRTTLGRIYQSISVDGGIRWSIPTATDLSSSYSPCRLRRIPISGDLICIWNQVSKKEIKKGFRRGRICSAISTDDGLTWKYLNTISTSGLDDVNYIKPSKPEFVRANKELGLLSIEALNQIGYPNVGFIADQILINYMDKLIILPYKWFYATH